MSASGSVGGSRHRHNEGHESTKLRLTPEEIRVLRECRRDGFYYRSVPFSAVAMIAAHYAVKMGYLRPNPKWGSLVKVMGCGVFAYFVGKASYISTCEQRVMQVPNGQLAELLRRRKQGLTVFPEL